MGWVDNKAVGTLQLRQKSLPQAEDICKICMLSSPQQSLCKLGTHKALAVTGNNIAVTVISNLILNINRITNHVFWFNVNVRQLVYVHLLLQLLFLYPTKHLSVASGSRSFTDSKTLPVLLGGQGATLQFVRLHVAPLPMPQD
jgi:hypothetical protein